MGKTEQAFECSGRARLRPSGIQWDAGKPSEFDRVLAGLTAGVIEEDQPYLVLMEIDREDAGREEVETFCTQLAFSELRSCLNNEMGVQLRQIANELSANHDLIMVEASAGLQGGNELERVLQAEGPRDCIRWRHILVSKYLAYVSARLDVEIERLFGPPVDQPISVIQLPLPESPFADITSRTLESAASDISGLTS